MLEPSLPYLDNFRGISKTSCGRTLEPQNKMSVCLLPNGALEQPDFCCYGRKPDNISNGQADNWTILLAMFRDRLGLDQFSEELIDTCLGIFLVNDFEINNSVSSSLIIINNEYWGRRTAQTEILLSSRPYSPTRDSKWQLYTVRKSVVISY